jgi:hypothetical protein
LQITADARLATSPLPDDGRTRSDDHRICIHEASHATVMRYISDKPLKGATVEPGETFAGRVWGQQSHIAELSNVSVESLNSVVRNHSPEPGVSNGYLADVFLHSFNRCIGLVAGTVGEKLFLGEGEPWPAWSDVYKSRDYARLICKSESAVEHLLEACKAEAEQILRDSEHIVMAIATELRTKRTISGEEIDACIARAVAARALADELSRRAAWRQITERAANTAFT